MNFAAFYLQENDTETLQRFYRIFLNFEFLSDFKFSFFFLNLKSSTNFQIQKTAKNLHILPPSNISLMIHPPIKHSHRSLNKSFEWAENKTHTITKQLKKYPSTQKKRKRKRKEKFSFIKWKRFSFHMRINYLRKKKCYL